ncbi:hypothetical protein E2I00_012984, partial [Balaenoptera physalus]
LSTLPGNIFRGLGTLPFPRHPSPKGFVVAFLTHPHALSQYGEVGKRAEPLQLVSHRRFHLTGSWDKGKPYPF